MTIYKTLCTNVKFKIKNIKVNIFEPSGNFLEKDYQCEGNYIIPTHWISFYLIMYASWNQCIKHINYIVPLKYCMFWMLIWRTDFLMKKIIDVCHKNDNYFLNCFQLTAFIFLEQF